MSEIEEKVVRYARDTAEFLARGTFNNKLSESPIERALYSAIIVVNQFEGFVNTAVLKSDDDYSYFRVLRQVKIESYRIDLVGHVWTGKRWANIAIECDGHEFHERTKEQAKRDRSRDRRLQDLGYKVYRFTGSEIFADPIKCARQIVKWANKTWWSEA